MGYTSILQRIPICLSFSDTSIYANLIFTLREPSHMVVVSAAEL